MTTTAEEIKEKVKKFRDTKEEGKSQKLLEEELGQGVEKVPPEPIKPDVILEKKDFFGVLDMRTMVDELAKFPDVEEVEKDMDKYDKYEAQVRRLWIIKQSDSDSWDITMRVIDKKEENGRIQWKVENGKYVTENKKFYYNPIAICDKEYHYNLLNERESARQDLLLEIANIKNYAAKTRIDQDEFDDYRNKRPWMEKTRLFQVATQKYYTELFKGYFATDDDNVNRILFDDVMNYVDVALYKEQVKSPK